MSDKPVERGPNYDWKHEAEHFRIECEKLRDLLYKVEAQGERDAHACSALVTENEKQRAEFQTQYDKLLNQSLERLEVLRTEIDQLKRGLTVETKNNKSTIASALTFQAEVFQLRTELEQANNTIIAVSKHNLELSAEKETLKEQLAAKEEYHKEDCNRLYTAAVKYRDSRDSALVMCARLRTANAELVDVLQGAQYLICDMYCGYTHHEVCERPTQALEKYSLISDPKE